MLNSKDERQAFLRKSYLILGIIAFIALFFVVFLGARHDHRYYMLEWDNILNGINAYARPTNAYGPTFNALAILYGLHDKLPRLLFVSCWIGLLLFFVKLIATSRHMSIEASQRWMVFIFMIPVYWIYVVWDGTNDILMIALLFVSLYLYRREKWVLSGMCMALSIGVKFMPIVMVPFLVCAHKRWRWKYLFSVLMGLTIIYGISYGVWGDMIMRPFQFATDRPSTILSIFRFLRGEYSPLRLFTDNPNVDHFSSPIIMLSLVLWWCTYMRLKLDMLLSATIAMALTVLFYRVGHHNFYMPVIALFVYWFILNFETASKYFRLTAFKWFMVWSSLVTVHWSIVWSSYQIHKVESYLEYGLKDIVGLPTFIVFACFVWGLVRYALKHRDKVEVSEE